jgi:c-di-GMP-related signal transduction protein
MFTAIESPPLDAGPEALAVDTTAAVGRQAIVDRKRDVVGYELFSHQVTENAPPALLTVLTLEGKDALAGRKTVFIECPAPVLLGDQLDLVRPDGVVLWVPPLPGAPQAEIDALTVRLARLRKKGFQLAFSQSVLVSSYAEWLALASVIRIDLRAIQPALLEAVVKKAKAAPGVRLLAQHVETAEQFARLSELGVALFQGAWFSQPVLVQARVIRPSQATVIQLINLVRGDADLGEIENLLKKDPTLSFNLLRFINSSGFGLSCEITSFRHAAMILGQKNLFRWAALLLTAAKNTGSPPVVGTTAIVRGRLTELLAAELLPTEDCDHAFVVGVFSLLDAMLGVPMAQALNALSLPDPVLDALLHRQGKFAPFLDLTIACERGEDAGFADAARTLQLSNHQINLAHLHALAWADTLFD